jgi:hypothetical protein
LVKISTTKNTIVATRALIIGKGKDGQYHYGQTNWDGMDNL